MYGFLHSPVSLLMGALSDALGQSADFEDGDECVLEFDDGVDVVVAQIRETQFLSLRSPVTEAGRPLDAVLLQLALSLNYTSMPPGYTVAMDQASLQLMLVALIDADHTPPDYFLSLVAGFLELVPRLRDQCGVPHDNAPPPWTGTEVLA